MASMEPERDPRVPGTDGEIVRDAFLDGATTVALLAIHTATLLIAAAIFFVEALILHVLHLPPVETWTLLTLGAVGPVLLLLRTLRRLKRDIL